MIKSEHVIFKWIINIIFDIHSERIYCLEETFIVVLLFFSFQTIFCVNFLVVSENNRNFVPNQNTFNR